MHTPPVPFGAARSRRALLVAGGKAGLMAAATLPLAACLRDPSPSEASPSSASPAGSSPTPSETATVGASASANPSATANPLTKNDASAAPEDTWSTGSTSGTGEGSCGVEVDVRTGVHEGYDRVVVEMSGDGRPGWWADWVDRATTLGKGDPITLDGEHLLSVVGSGTVVPSTQAEWDEVYQGPTRITVGGQGVAEVWFDHTIESDFQVVIGAASVSYRVFTLSAPTRLVIDVAHP